MRVRRGWIRRCQWRRQVRRSALGLATSSLDTGAMGLVCDDAYRVHDLSAAQPVATHRFRRAAGTGRLCIRIARIRCGGVFSTKLDWVVDSGYNLGCRALAALPFRTPHVVTANRFLACLFAGIEHPVVHSPGEFKRSSRPGGLERGSALGLGGLTGIRVTILADGSARNCSLRRSYVRTGAPARLKLTLHCGQPCLSVGIRRCRHSIPALFRPSRRTGIGLVNGVPAVNTLVHLLGSGRARPTQRQQHKRS